MMAFPDGLGRPPVPCELLSRALLVRVVPSVSSSPAGNSSASPLRQVGPERVTVFAGAPPSTDRPMALAQPVAQLLFLRASMSMLQPPKTHLEEAFEPTSKRFIYSL